jgi:ubiquitin carboxyl-terminal hydrolase 5/13
LFSIPEWEKRYSTSFEIHPHECPFPYDTDGKASCLECQISKVSNGLLSGRYSTPHTTLHPDGTKEQSQPGISPRMLKSLIGQGHAEFAGMKQQDAQEFLIWLLSRVQRQGKAGGKVQQTLEDGERSLREKEGWGGYVDPTRVFRFVVQQRIQCLGCGGVKYRVDEQDNINISVPERLKQYTPLLSLSNVVVDPPSNKLHFRHHHRTLPNTNPSNLKTVSKPTPQNQKSN